MGKHGITGLDTDTEETVLDGINKVADYSRNMSTTVNERVDGINEKVEKTETAILKVEEKMSKKLDESVDIIADKIERMQKRQMATGSISLIDTTDCLVAAMTPEEKQMIPFHEATMSPEETERGGRLANAVFKTASEHWFAYATRAQHKKWQAEWNSCISRMEKLSLGFVDGYMNAEEKTLFVEDTDSMGGYLVPSPVAAEINKLIQDNTVVRPFARKIPMSSKTLDIPKKGANFSASIIGEGTVGGDTIPDVGPASAFKMVQLIAKKMGGRATASIESIQDSAVGLLSYIRGEIAEELGILEDQQALEGDGTGSNFTGVAADADVNEHDGSGAADYAHMSLALLLNIMFAARHRASRIGCRWFMAPEVLARTIGMVDDNNQPIFQWNAIPNAPHGTILGFPVEPVSSISITRSSGAESAVLSQIYFGPPRGITFGDRQGLAWDVSEAPNFNDYLLDMRLIRRTAIGITNPYALTRAIGVHTVKTAGP